jgi:hypothetical protein
MPSCTWFSPAAIAGVPSAANALLVADHTNARYYTLRARSGGYDLAENVEDGPHRGRGLVA